MRRKISSDVLFESFSFGEIDEDQYFEALSEIDEITVVCMQCGKSVLSTRQPWDPPGAVEMHLGYCDDCPSNACDGGPVYYYDRNGKEIREEL